jgi:hypothetical protein
LPHIDIVVRFAPALFQFDDRKQAAEVTREQVVALAQK